LLLRLPPGSTLVPYTTLFRSEGGVGAVDSAGVRIVVSDPEARGVPRWQVAAEPVLVLGAVDGPPEVLFDRVQAAVRLEDGAIAVDRKSTRLNSSHVKISYAVF